jgi:hypothetical protein
VNLKQRPGCYTGPLAWPRDRCGTGNTRLLPPKILEPRRRQFCVPDRVLYVLVPQVGLQRTGVVAFVGQGITTGVAKHVRVSAAMMAIREEVAKEGALGTTISPIWWNPVVRQRFWLTSRTKNLK